MNLWWKNNFTPLFSYPRAFFPSKKYMGVSIKTKRYRKHIFNVYKAKNKCYSSVNEEYFYSTSDLAGHLVWVLLRALEANR